MYSVQKCVQLLRQGIKAVVAQQFEVGKQIIAAGLVPIIEPEVDINSPKKAEAEAIYVLKVVALSGGYSREEANKRTSCNKGVIASFSRALTEGLVH